MHVCLLTELTPCHTRRDTHTTSDSTPELPVHEPRTHPSFHPGNTQPMYAKLHAEMQPHTRYAGTYPGGRCSDPKTFPEAIRSFVTAGCHEMIFHPMHGRSQLTSPSHTSHTFMPPVAPVSVATRNRTISSPRHCLGIHSICLHLCHERTLNSPAGLRSPTRQAAHRKIRDTPLWYHLHWQSCAPG